MSWIRKSPFGRDEDPAKHMLTLLANEAERSGAPFSEEEKEVLGSGILPVPLELDAKARGLIDEMFEKEDAVKPSERDPKGFGSCLEWSDCAAASNAVELAYEVASARSTLRHRPIKWGLWFKDKMVLVGCAFVAVILMMLFAGAISLLFDRK